MDRTRQQDIATFAQAAAEAQHERPRRRTMTARARAAIYGHQLNRADSSVPHGVPGRVVFDLNSVSGLKAAEGRQMVVTLDYPELGRVLGAIPASALPDGVTAAMGAVLRWLRTGEVLILDSQPSFEAEADPDHDFQWRVVRLSRNPDEDGRTEGWVTGEHAEQDAGIAARLLTELGGRLPGELAEMVRYTPNERGGS